MSISGLPFDDIRALLSALPAADERAEALARERDGALFGGGATGRIGEVLAWLAAWSGKSPAISRPVTAIFAGTHGTQDEAARAAVADRVARIAAGQAAVNQICVAHDLGLKVFDLALKIPTADMTGSEALSERDAAATVAFGMEAIAGGIDLLCVADCASHTAISAAAIFAALHGGPPKRWCECDMSPAVEAALSFHKGRLGDPLEVLRRLGGRETCAIAGAILAARVQHIPVILDGPGVLAAAAVLKAADAGAIDHCMAGQGGSDGVRGQMLSALGMAPLLPFSMTLYEGEGAALAAGVVRAAALMHSGQE